MKKIYILLLSAAFLVSLSGCTKGQDSSADSAGSQNQTTQTTDKGYDFTGLDSQKYAELFAHKQSGSQYTLKWSYDKKYENKEINYICYDGTSGNYSLYMTQPLFNNVKFILKDHKIYDIYDERKTYSVTDVKQTAMEYGYMTTEEFESYAADIFAGLKFLGSGTDKPDGSEKEYKYDAFTTSKGVELLFLTDDNGELYAIRADYDDNDTAYMYIEELTESVDASVFEIPSGYKENAPESDTTSGNNVNTAETVK